MIEVGEYGRTNTGKIFIFAWLEYEVGKTEKSKVILGDGKTFANNFYYFNENEKIVKHSKNIIDLIEEGDYVNGCKVYENRKTYLIVHQKVENSEIDYNFINHDEIKSIVTKEQFVQVEYRVEE